MRLPPVETADEPLAPPHPIDPTLSWAEARRRALEAFERSFALALLQHHRGHVATAAAAAGIDKAYLHRVLRRHGGKS
jgi:transcriptional regulator of acetoin/glycerol metabolism